MICTTYTCIAAYTMRGERRVSKFAASPVRVAADVHLFRSPRGDHFFASTSPGWTGSGWFEAWASSAQEALKAITKQFSPDGHCVVEEITPRFASVEVRDNGEPSADEIRAALDAQARVADGLRHPSDIRAMAAAFFVPQRFVASRAVDV